MITDTAWLDKLDDEADFQEDIDFLVGLDRDDDLWGWAMAHMFAICHVLYMNDEVIPHEWQFRAGLGEDQPREDYPDCELERMYADGTINGDDLRHAGRVFTRYLDACKERGLDY